MKLASAAALLPVGSGGYEVGPGRLQTAILTTICWICKATTLVEGRGVTLLSANGKKTKKKGRRWSIQERLKMKIKDEG